MENINETLESGHLVFTLGQKKNYTFYDQLVKNCELESLEFTYKFPDDIDREHFFEEIGRGEMAEAQLEIYDYIDQFNTEIATLPKPA